MMGFFPCSKEKAVWRGAATGECEPGLREHAESCPTCREAALITRAIKEARGDTTGQVALPDPRQIWWRAHWLQARATGEHATWPITLYQRVAAAVALAGLGALACSWTGQRGLFASYLPVPVLLVAGIVVVALAGLLAFRAVEIEE
jgi:hypothetical protein